MASRKPCVHAVKRRLIIHELWCSSGKSGLNGLVGGKASDAEVTRARNYVEESFRDYTWWRNDAEKLLAQYLSEIWIMTGGRSRLAQSVYALPVQVAGVRPGRAQLRRDVKIAHNMRVGGAKALRSTEKTYYRVVGVQKTLAAGGQAVLGTMCVLAPEPTMATKVAGGVLYYRAADNGAAGLTMLIHGRPETTLSHKAIAYVAESAGASRRRAHKIAAYSDCGIDVAANVGGGIAYSHSCMLLAKNPSLMGRYGMMKAQVSQNTVRIDSLSKTAKYRVPDGVGRGFIAEVKYRAIVNNTAQLKDFSLFAQKEGQVFHLFTRTDAHLSAPLLAQAEAGNVIIHQTLSPPPTFPMSAVPVTALPEAPDIIFIIIEEDRDD